MAYKLGMKPQPSQVTVDLNQNPKDWERRNVVEKSVTHIWGKSKATIEGCGLSGTPEDYLELLIYIPEYCGVVRTWPSGDPVVMKLNRL